MAAARNAQLGHEQCQCQPEASKAQQSEIECLLSVVLRRCLDEIATSTTDRIQTSCSSTWLDRGYRRGNGSPPNHSFRRRRLRPVFDGDSRTECLLQPESSSHHYHRVIYRPCEPASSPQAVLIPDASTGPDKRVSRSSMSLDPSAQFSRSSIVVVGNTGRCDRRTRSREVCRRLITVVVLR